MWTQRGSTGWNEHVSNVKVNRNNEAAYIPGHVRRPFVPVLLHSVATQVYIKEETVRLKYLVVHGNS